MVDLPDNMVDLLDTLVDTPDYGRLSWHIDSWFLVFLDVILFFLGVLLEMVGYGEKPRSINTKQDQPRSN